MKQGTVSVLFGCHSIIHSFWVYYAWTRYYHRLPLPWEAICIVIHDIGHIGKDYLNDIEEKKRHWILGARAARLLSGQRGYLLCAGHCEYSGLPRSKLYYADKLCWLYEPYWWAWWNALVEPKLRMGYTIKEAYTRFHQQVRASVESGEFRSTHALYIERCRDKHGH